MASATDSGGTGVGHKVIHLFSGTVDGGFDRKEPLLSAVDQENTDIASLVSQLRAGDISQQERAATLLLKRMIRSSDVLDDLIRQGGLPPLIQVIEIVTHGALQEAASIVAKIATSRQRESAFVDAGGVRTLLGAPMASKNPATRRNALSAIVELMELQGRVVIEQVADSGAIRPLATLAERGNNFERKQAARALYLMSELGSAMHIKIGQEGGILAMLKLSEAVSDTARCFSARALAKMSESPESGDQIVQLNGIPALIRLLGDADEDVQNSAAYALANLSVRSRARRKMKKNGALNALVDVLEKGKSDAAASAACSLGNMAQEEGNREAIVDRGAAPLLLDLLLINNTKSHIMSLAALGNLARSRGPRDAIFKTNRIWSIVGEMASEDPIINQHAVRAVTNLAINKAHKSTIAMETDAIKHLVALLDVSLLETRRLAAGCLALLALAPESRKLMLERKALMGLVGLLEGCSNRCKEQAAYAISVLLEPCEEVSQDLRERMASEVSSLGGVGPLVTLLESRFGFSSLHAVCAVANLSAVSAEIQQEIGQAGAIRPLVELLRSNEQVQKKAVSALEQLAQIEANQRPIAHCGGIPRLIHIMHTGNDECKALAASALANTTFPYSSGGVQTSGSVETQEVERGYAAIEIPSNGSVQMSLVQEKNKSKLIVRGEVSPNESKFQGHFQHPDSSSVSPSECISRWFNGGNKKCPLTDSEVENLNRIPDRLLQAIAVQIRRQ